MLNSIDNLNILLTLYNCRCSCTQFKPEFNIKINPYNKNGCYVEIKSDIYTKNINCGYKEIETVLNNIIKEISTFLCNELQPVIDEWEYKHPELKENFYKICGDLK